jgi:hypothetical protein
MEFIVLRHGGGHVVVAVAPWKAAKKGGGSKSGKGGDAMDVDEDEAEEMELEMIPLGRGAFQAHRLKKLK